MNKIVRNKLFLIFLFLITILISFCSAVDIGISPGTIILSEKQNEIACTNFTIIGEDENIFNGDIKWSNENSRKINDYTMSSEKLNINATIPSGIKAGQYKICISSKRAGNYYGALMYKLNNSSYRIGTWVELKVEGENSIKNVLSLTGSTIEKIDAQKIFLFSPILFLITLFLLLKKLKSKNKTEFNSKYQNYKNI